MKETRSQRTLIGRNKNPFYWLIGERTKLQRRTQLQRYNPTPCTPPSVCWELELRVQAIQDGEGGGQLELATCPLLRYSWASVGIR